MTSVRKVFHTAIAAGMALAFSVAAHAQGTIKIGEINSY